MMRYENIKFVLVSPKELQVPDYIRDDLVRSGYEFEEVERLEDAIGKMDILYMTRVQRERFFNESASASSTRKTTSACGTATSWTTRR